MWPLRIHWYFTVPPRPFVTMLPTTSTVTLHLSPGAAAGATATDVTLNTSCVRNHRTTPTAAIIARVRKVLSTLTHRRDRRLGLAGSAQSGMAGGGDPPDRPGPNLTGAAEGCRPAG